MKGKPALAKAGKKSRISRRCGPGKPRRWRMPAESARGKDRQPPRATVPPVPDGRPPGLSAPSRDSDALQPTPALLRPLRPRRD